MERCTKTDALRRLQAFPHLLKFQISELTSQHRRECIKSLHAFLEENRRDGCESLDLAASIASKRRRAKALLLSHRGGSLFDPLFDSMLAFTGIAANSPSQAMRMWQWFYRPLYVSIVLMMTMRFAEPTWPGWSSR